MKKILLIALLVSVLVQAKAQWAGNTTTIYNTNTGNVGIGTSTPSATLNVDPKGGGGITIGNPSVFNGGWTSLQLGISASQNGYASIQVVKSSGTSMGDLILAPSAGNVGIKTTTPTEVLDVNGNPVVGTLPERLSLASMGIGFNRKVATGGIYDNTHSAFQFTHKFTASPAADYLAFEVYNPSGTNVNPLALTINNTAQIGVNTAYVPAGFQFAVNGSAIATAITVKLRSNWPDYVFKKAYQLPTLSYIKTYIDQNHHLPEMPSAKDVEANGMDVGEMNTLLLKKVEELTLYLIEKDKEMGRQQEQINQIKRAQQRQLNLLKKAVTQLSKSNR
ncbi:hypothetical protein [Mucilaginibacter sp.]|uniref:hypothetical protein n=1 Tax=Mucilaginibacter sp. TaxID=1882438 RepID=UPI0032644B4E